MIFQGLQLIREKGTTIVIDNFKDERIARQSVQYDLKITLPCTRILQQSELRWLELFLLLILL